MNAARFKIALSFAGEKRNYVSKVADILANQLGESSILYDKFHEAEFARRDLGIYLPELYHKEAELIVVFICDDYDKKQWTGLEWMAIHDLLSKKQDYRIMICRFGRASVAGLYSNSGFVSCDKKKPSELADLILNRLKLVKKNKKKLEADYQILDTQTPNNLPSLQPFFGRKRELKLLRTFLNTQTSSWGKVICGPGGIGKTSLALCAAYLNQERFQRTIFISFKKFDFKETGREKPNLFFSSYFEMINEVSNQIGKKNIPKIPEIHRDKKLLEQLRLVNILFVFDNVESLKNIDRRRLLNFLNLLPGNCKAIVTSREVIDKASNRLHLKKIDLNTALKIAIHVSSVNPVFTEASRDDWVTLYRETDGNPLLFLWTLGQVGRGDCLSLLSAINLLKSCPTKNDPLEFIYGKLSLLFTIEEAKIMSVLSLFRLPAKIEHLVVITDLNDSLISKILNSLVNRSFVIFNELEQSYILLPIVREFAKRQQPTMTQRLQNILVSKSTKFSRECGYRNYHEFQKLDVNWPLIDASLPFMMDRSNKTIQDFCAAMTFFLEFCGRWDERIAINSSAERKAISNKDYVSAGWRNYENGWIFYLRNQIDELIETSKSCSEYFSKGKSGVIAQSYAIRLNGLVFFLQKNYIDAILVFKDMLNLRRSIEPQSIHTANALNDVGRAYRFSGNFKKAKVYFKRALKLAFKIAYMDGIATYTGNLADVALDLCDWETAEHTALQAIKYAEGLGRKLIIASSHVYLVRALLGQKKYEDALPYISISEKICSELDFPMLSEVRNLEKICKVNIASASKRKNTNSRQQ